jgi:hypothetical protein
MAAIILCRTEREQAVAGAQLASQNSFELPAASNPFFPGKRKLLQDSTAIKPKSQSEKL